jgi:hypothetical protein
MVRPAGWRSTLFFAALLAVPLLVVTSMSTARGSASSAVRAETTGGTARVDAIANAPEARVVGRSERRLTASTRDTVAVLAGFVLLLALVLVGRVIVHRMSAIQSRGLRAAVARGPPSAAAVSFA